MIWVITQAIHDVPSVDPFLGDRGLLDYRSGMKYHAMEAPNFRVQD